MKAGSDLPPPHHHHKETGILADLDSASTVGSWFPTLLPLSLILSSPPPPPTVKGLRVTDLSRFGMNLQRLIFDPGGQFFNEIIGGTWPTGQIFFNFMQFLEKIGHDNRFALLPAQQATLVGYIFPPPLGNPGSATVTVRLNKYRPVFVVAFFPNILIPTEDAQTIPGL